MCVCYREMMGREKVLEENIREMKDTVESLNTKLTASNKRCQDLQHLLRDKVCMGQNIQTILNS